MKKVLIVGLFLIGHDLVAMSRTKPMMFNPRLLKGTHEIEGVPREYAPVRGLTFLDCKISEQWYRQSAKFQKKPMDQLLQNAKTTWQKDGRDQYIHWDKLKEVADDYKNNPIQNLIMQMYHIAGGTFTVTNAPNNPVRQYSPYILGKILKLVHEATQAAVVDFKKLQTQLEEMLTQFQLKDPAGKPFKAKDHRPFVSALIAALQDVSDVYPQYTVQGVIIGYMLSKSNTRSYLQEYLRGFTGKDIVLDDQIYSVIELEDIAQQHFSAVDWSQLADYMCARVYVDVYAAQLPAITSNMSIAYQKYRFTDCVESTMLNLVNIVTYSEGRLGFVFPQGIQPSKQLQDFYAVALHQNPAEIKNIKVHEAWAQCVEHVQGCLYNQVGVLGTAEFYEVLKEFEGFMPMPASIIDTTLPRYTITINNRSYELYVYTVGNKNILLVPDNLGLVCFELMPTLSNIIVLMNTLFGLKLYQRQADVLSSDFEQTMFPKLCQKLDWRVDTVDYGALEKRITVETEKGRFFIYLMYKEHGYVFVDNSCGRRGYVCIDMKDDFSIDRAQLLSLNAIKYDSAVSQLVSFVPALNLDRCNRLLIDAIKSQAPEQYIVSLMRYMMLNSQDRHYMIHIFTSLVGKEEVQLSRAVFDSLITWAIAIQYGIAELDILGEQYQAWLRELVQDGTPIQEDEMYTIRCMALGDSLRMVPKQRWLNVINRGKESALSETLILICMLVDKEIVDQSDRALILELANRAKDKRYPCLRYTLDLIERSVDAGIVDKNDRVLLLELVNLAKKTELSSAFSLMKLLVDKEIVDKNDRNLLLGLIDRGMLSFYDYTIQVNALKESLLAKGIDVFDQSQVNRKSLFAGTDINLMRHDPAQAIALNQAKYLQQAGVGQQDQLVERYDEVAAREMEKERARIAQAVESMQSGDRGVPYVRTSPAVVPTLPKVSSVPAVSKTIAPQVAVSKAMQKGFKPIARR